MKTYSSLPNFRLDRSIDLLKHLDPSIQDFHELIQYLHQLNYRRISDRENLENIFIEQCATCSTKHALIKTVVDAHRSFDIQLIIAIYKMDQFNTPGIGDILTKNRIKYLPEAHCYLKYQNKRYDFTFPDSDIQSLSTDILQETSILPDQIGAFKIAHHQAFLEEWIQTHDIDYDLDELWSIRESCILALSNS